jgi:polyphosphate kinase 2
VNNTCHLTEFVRRSDDPLRRVVIGPWPCPAVVLHAESVPASCRSPFGHPRQGTWIDTRGVIRENFREYLDHLLRDGYSVRHDEHLSDPDLIDPGGNPVETWREDYPYDERLDRDVYEEEKYQLQIELLKFQYWAQDAGTKHLILFEGRDAAGKGGTIKRFTEHLNPRAARVVALTKPTETERGQWYFHRYIAQLPTAGEIVLFDRSWYNRAGVERVMGFCTDRDYEIFLRQAPLFEEMLTESGFSLTKLWFSVTRSEQRTRFAIRQIDPVRRWKLSPMDIESLDRWDEPHPGPAATPGVAAPHLLQQT